MNTEERFSAQTQKMMEILLHLFVVAWWPRWPGFQRSFVSGCISEGLGLKSGLALMFSVSQRQAAENLATQGRKTLLRLESQSAS